jgi:hypothetical protein
MKVRRSTNHSSGSSNAALLLSAALVGRPRMQQFDDLFKSYIASGMDPATVTTWHAAHSPSQEMLSALAESIGAAFLAGRINFNAANGLLNQLMPLSGFESAPRRFWDFYTVFEDFETSNDPDTDAKSAVAAAVSAGAA